MEVLTVLVSTVQVAVWSTAGLLAVATALYILYRAGSYLGRPLVRRIFGLAYSDDKHALHETGVIGVAILTCLCIFTLSLELYLAQQEEAGDLPDWDAGMFALALSKACIEAILILGMLSGVALLIPFRSSQAEGRSSRLKAWA